MGPFRVLVVDDDTETLALLREILVKEGYEVSIRRMLMRRFGDIPRGASVVIAAQFAPWMAWLSWQNFVRVFPKH
jgi:CheY-like chemotaxis protein